MTKEDRDTHINAKLTLLMIDRAERGDPEPLSPEHIAKETGLTVSEVRLIEFNALKKLRNHPKAWEAITASFRQ